MDDFERITVELRWRRAAGYGFEQAWERALSALPASPLKAREHGEDTLSALRGTRDAWRRAYVGAPALSRETAAAALLGALAPEPGRRYPSDEPAAGPSIPTHAEAPAVAA